MTTMTTTVFGPYLTELAERARRDRHQPSVRVACSCGWESPAGAGLREANARFAMHVHRTTR